MRRRAHTRPPSPIGAGRIVGGVQQASPTPYGSLSFAQTSFALTQASAILGNFAATTTGKVDTEHGHLWLTGSEAGLNVFNVTTEQMTGISQLKIEAPTTSTVLVNVTGSTLNMMYFGMLANVTASNILFNFKDATALSFAGFGWQGSILAPGAAVAAKWGEFNGSVIVKSLEGNTHQNAEFHNKLFTGNITTTPVPGPIAGAGLPVLVVLGGLVWARSRKMAAAA